MKLSQLALMVLIAETAILKQGLSIMENNYYNILGLSSDASEKEIRKAYRELAKIYHPDRNTEKDAEEKFREIVQAYEVLSDPVKKKVYDKYGDENHPHIKESPINFDEFFSAFNKHFQFPKENSYNKFFSYDSGKYFTLDEMFSPDYEAANNHFQHKSNSGRCRTVTQRFGNMVTTYTQCT
ncbi:dnaJ homolog subfamily B member 9-like [Centruroides vittatus]|uniref:dnaJ homolog subfamily B member 9-like n=1 Tax=Centruroides vittatus TaxID=120091 RepID=UPI003510BB9D